MKVQTDDATVWTPDKCLRGNALGALLTRFVEVSAAQAYSTRPIASISEFERTQVLEPLDNPFGPRLLPT